MIKTLAFVSKGHRDRGHGEPKTTARYDRRPEAAKRRAASKLHFPWRHSKGWEVETVRSRRLTTS